MLFSWMNTVGNKSTETDNWLVAGAWTAALITSKTLQVQANMKDLFLTSEGKYNSINHHLQKWTWMYHSTVEVNDSIDNYFTYIIYETNLLKLQQLK